MVELRLAPAVDAAGRVDRVEVRLRFSEAPGDFGETGPFRLAVARGEADAISELFGRDAEGALPLDVRPTPEREERIEIRSSRRPVGGIAVGYRVDLSRAARARGAHGGVHAYGAGFTALGESLLLLPDAADTYKIRMGWDLAGAGRGAVGLSSFGEGDVELEGPLERLRDGVFLGGPAGHVRVDEGDAHLSFAWLGKLAFDPVEAAAFTARAHEDERAFFHEPGSTPLTVFLEAARHVGPWPAGGYHGPALELSIDEQASFSGLVRLGVAARLAERWIGGPEGVSVESEGHRAGWFAHGFSAYLGAEALLGSGHVSPEDFAAWLREHAAHLATSPDKGRSDKALAERLRTEPFEAGGVSTARGLFYAAELDQAIKAHSGGKRSLHAVVLELLHKAREAGHGVGLSEPGFRELVVKEAGAGEGARFDAAMVRGEALAPAASAFGPCFTGKREKLARFELGMGRESLDERKVVKLEPRSPAERAGLREGDEIVSTSGAFAGAPGPTVFVVRRDGKEKRVSFTARGPAADGVAFHRAPKVPDARCTGPARP